MRARGLYVPDLRDDEARSVDAIFVWDRLSGGTHGIDARSSARKRSAGRHPAGDESRERRTAVSQAQVALAIFNHPSIADAVVEGALLAVKGGHQKSNRAGGHA